MSKDSPDNPFRKLSEQLAQRGQKALRPAGARRAAPEAQERPAPEDDAALFLDAVSRISPLQHKAGRRRQLSGESLAAHLKAGQNQAQAAARGQNQAQAAARGQNRAQAAARGQDRARPASPPSPPRSWPRPAAGEADAPCSVSSGSVSSGAVPGLCTDGRTLFAAAMEGLFERPAPQAPSASAASPEADDTDEEALFAKAVHGALPLGGRGRALSPGAEKKPAAPARDPAEALREILEGRVEFALHHSDEYQEGFVLGLDPLVLARLRAGRYSPEKHLDLHGLNARQAHEALTHFIKNAYQRNMRCVVVVTGRGRNSPDGVGVLRPLIQVWLTRDPFKRVVLAFCTARAGDGGAGALYVLLRKYKKNRGKIIWERRPTDDDFPD